MDKFQLHPNTFICSSGFANILLETTAKSLLGSVFIRLCRAKAFFFSVLLMDFCGTIFSSINLLGVRLLAEAFFSSEFLIWSKKLLDLGELFFEFWAVAETNFESFFFKSCLLKDFWAGTSFLGSLIEENHFSVLRDEDDFFRFF